MPGTGGEPAVRESGAAGEPLPASGNVLLIVLAIALAAGAGRASIGAPAIPPDTRLTGETTLALSRLDGGAVGVAASTWRLTTPAGAPEIEGAGVACTGAAAMAASLDVTP